MLKIYNSATKQKENFNPLVQGKVGIYACGVTVYDLCHLGHARTALAMDVVVNYLKILDYEVTYVRNITDIDDKIIQRAEKLGCSAQELAEKMTQEMQQDFNALGFLAPTFEPRATQYIQKMQEMIAKLLENGFAYVHPQGDVYFQVSSFKDYGALSRQKIDLLSKNSRVSHDQKINSHDFVLWKIVPEGSEALHNPSWESPWGKGRPGWHIECSAMSQALLGETFDLHAGGCDLKFPHHENERAQSICANQAPFARQWMHVGMVTVHQEKMSKSLGNFVTLRDLLKKYQPEVIRMFLAQSHYRTPLDFNESNLNLAHQKLKKLYGSLRENSLSLESEPLLPSKFSQEFHEAMCDDFNTPLAISVLLKMASKIFRLKAQLKDQKAREFMKELKSLASILGFLKKEPESFFKATVFEFCDEAEILKNIALRTKARLSKDWELADQIRQSLLKHGIALEDKKDGETIWSKLPFFENEGLKN